MSNDSPIEGVGFNEFIEAKKRLTHEPAALVKRQQILTPLRQ
jgi:hypothetical protein